MSENSPCVLIVDDEPSILDSLEDLLEDDFPILTTSDPAEGLRLLQTRPIGVVLSDQRMPRMQGHEFLTEVAKCSQATRLLITGYSDMDALVKAVNRSQIFAFVAKPWEPGHLKSLVGTAMEHFKLAQALLAEQHLMTNLMDTVPDPLVFVDLSGKLLRINRAAAELFELSLEEKPDGLLLQDLKQRHPSLASLLSSEPTQDRRLASVSLPGEGRRWYSVVQVPFGKGEGVICLTHDVTERREAELALVRQAKALERSHHDIHQFAHVTAHHLQEPLRDVVSHLQLLKKRLKLGLEEQEVLDYAVSGARRMKTLFSDFIHYIDLSVDSAQQELVPLDELWAKVVDVCAPELEKAGCIPEIANRLPKVQGSRQHLEFLLAELLRNALRFRHPDRPLTVSVTSEETAEEHRLRLCDNGHGVRTEEKETMFGLFQRLETSSHTGTGLGLALCRKIMTLHEGRIWADTNEPHPGLTVTITFPKGEEA